MADEKKQVDLVINLDGIESTQTQLRTMEKFIQQTEKRAKTLDKIKISPVVRIKDEITSPVTKIESKLKSLNGKTITVAIKTQYMTDNIGFELQKAIPTLTALGVAAQQWGNSFTGGGEVTKYAWGGVLTSPHLGMVAEAGPEAIIPLSPPMRSRAIDLWRRTGDMLGVPMHYDGGIFGEYSKRAGNAIFSNLVGQGISDEITGQKYDPASLTFTTGELLSDVIPEIAKEGDTGILANTKLGLGILNKVFKFAGAAYDIYESDDKVKASVQAAAGLTGSYLAEALVASLALPVLPEIALAAILGGLGYGVANWLSGSIYDQIDPPQKVLQIKGDINFGSTGTSQQLEQFLNMGNENKDNLIGEYANKFDSIYGTGNTTGYATGGILTRPHLGMVAEAGPEAIIPLSSRLRGRALDLWEEAGRYLGVRPYAMGGFAGALPAYAGAGNGGYGDIKVTSVNNLQVGSEIDVGTLALQIGNNIARDIKQALQNRA